MLRADVWRDGPQNRSPAATALQRLRVLLQRDVRSVEKAKATLACSTADTEFSTSGTTAASSTNEAAVDWTSPRVVDQGAKVSTDAGGVTLRVRKVVPVCLWAKDTV